MNQGTSIRRGFFSQVGGMLMPNEVKRIEMAFVQLSGAFVRALRQAAVTQGLDSDTSDRITRQMILGSVELLRMTEQSPAELITQVASEGGTTKAGMKVMDAANGIDSIVASTFAEAINAG